MSREQHRVAAVVALNISEKYRLAVILVVGMVDCLGAPVALWQLLHD